VTSGCATAPDDGDQLNTDSIESDITVLPSGGTWTYDTLTPVSTTCSVSGITQGESGPFTMDTVTASSFRIVPQDGLPAFTCSYSNAVFSCPNRATATIDLRPFIDVAVTVRITATGVMSDSHHARGKQDASVTCVGSQCSLLGTMPCGFVDNFSVHTP
jgi:hypothetical protein